MGNDSVRWCVMDRMSIVCRKPLTRSVGDKAHAQTYLKKMQDAVGNDYCDSYYLVKLPALQRKLNL